MSNNTMSNEQLAMSNCVPKLRFPGFEGNWEVKKVKDICDINTGKSNTQDQIENGQYPFYIRSATPVRSNRYLYDCEAVITIGDGQIGKVFHYVNGKFDLHQRCYMMSNFKDIMPLYFYYFFSENFYERAMRMSAKATVDSVRLEMISDMPILLPPTLPEQQKIADCLSSLDELIAANQQQVDSLKAHKKGLMQQLFPQEGETTPKLRFPGFEGEWEGPTIADVFDIRNGYTPSKREPSFWIGGTIPWFRMEDIRENGGILSDSIQHITPLGVKGSGLFKKNSIILATTATIGIHAMLIADSQANQRFTNFSIRESLTNLYSPQYIYYAFFGIDEWCKRNTNAGGLLSVNIPALLKQPFPTPTLPEQQKIADCLSALDEEIAAQQQKVEALKEHKKGLMQQLFPSMSNVK